MSKVTLGGGVGSSLIVASDVCVKSGRRTSERVTVRGSTTPGWIHLLLILTIVGWLIATGMSARSYQINLPFTHKIHARWRLLNLLAWCLSIGGVAAVFVAARLGADRPDLLLSISAAGIILGTVNAWANNVGVRQDREERLVLVRVHPASASAIVRAGTPTM